MKKDTKLTLLGEPQPVELEGIVERIIFHNADNGFTVLRLTDVTETEQNTQRKLADAQTIVGHTLTPKIGIRVKALGKYVNNQRFGRQLAFTSIDQIMPATNEGLEAYLASGLIKGVGPSTARRIVKKFGSDTIRILDEEPEQLKSISGIGAKNIVKIISSWNEHRGMRDLMLFLQPHGISAAYAVKIYKEYGASAKAIVSENPYRLAMDIHGIGFITADAIALKLGFAKDHPLRIQAAALYQLQRASDDGHVFLPVDTLAEQLEKQMDISPAETEKAIKTLELNDRVECETLRQGDGTAVNAIYLKRFYDCESKTAFYLERILHSPKSVRFKDAENIIQSVLNKQSIQFAPEQIHAITQSTQNKIMVITGGPGTGKTTLINAIIQVFEAANAKVLLAAPTGRAAKRMAETSGRDAKTIHRLLEYSPKENIFTRNEDNPLVCHLLIVDEASMMDTLLFYYLLKALPLGATLVLVGDVCQLPSVGPGNVLGDIIDSAACPVARLTQIFRQSAESEIICNAHLINKGKMPLLEKNPEVMSDFYFIPKDDPEAAADLIVELIKFHIPRRFKLDPVNDVQLLTPMHKGAVGAERMNARLQTALNPQGLEIRRGDKAFRLHDKVMQLRNNYDKDIYNGDIGRISYINPKERIVSVDFDGAIIPYEFDDLDELTSAYAISVHKSQGSEYPAVVVPIMMQHYVLLQRNLLYTAVTRGKKLVVLVGERRALQMAIHNNKTSKRNTWLAQRLERPQEF